MYVLNEGPIKMSQHEIKMLDLDEYHEVKAKYSKKIYLNLIIKQNLFTFANAFLKVFFKIRSSFGPLP